MPRPPAPSPALLRHLRSLAFSSAAPQSAFSRQKSLLRPLSTSSARLIPTPEKPSSRPANPYAPKSTDRGPTSAETTQTDFSKMDIFNTSSVPSPATSIDACTSYGFHLNNNVKTTDGSGIILVGGEAFLWRPWLFSAAPPASGSTSQPAAGEQGKQLLDKLGRLELSPSSLRLFELLHPKPDLLLFGTGSRLLMLSPATRHYISELGMRVDVMDTGNASAAYNLLAQERGVENGGGVGAALLPLGWKGG